MATNLFVGSLPFSITEDTLQQLFSQYGQVQSVKIIKDKYTGSSRGFGFVEMSNEKETQEAIAKLNGHNLEGRNIVVKEALPKPTFTNRGGGGRDFGRRGGFDNRRRF